MAAVKRKLHRRDYPKLEALAAEGRTRKGIAAELGMPFEDFRNEVKGNRVATLRLERGEAVHEQTLIDRLHKQADAKNPSAITPTIFLLKSRHKWVDSHRSAEPPQSVTNVTISLPAALPMARYEKEITAEVERRALTEAKEEDHADRN